MDFNFIFWRFHLLILLSTLTFEAHLRKFLRHLQDFPKAVKSI
ncbi:hypothetical protein C943_01753 [Mariniradius saccharolyticus AK6]|uniref:Uncharacterized protein n=1 Tax=Mariniradius saccharolyticus AK6 TaxID=1239962 RepID=M7XA69_9BACT|nr:hypothetical protein C943_01753 [Mariniradius saccharolyticus AK6]